MDDKPVLVMLPESGLLYPCYGERGFTLMRYEYQDVNCLFTWSYLMDSTYPIYERLLPHG